MRVHVNKDDSNDAYQDYRNIIQGRKIQEHMAIELHRLAGVDRGPCGLEEFTAYISIVGDVLHQTIFPDFQGTACPQANQTHQV